MSRLGWAIGQFGQLQVSAFIRFPLLQCPWHTLVWFAEKAWQDRLLSLHSHRASLANYPNIDQHLTRKVLARFSPTDRRLLVREIAGAFQTRVQQAIWDSKATPVCRWCGKEDTKAHRYFCCTATQSVRAPISSLLESLASFDCLWPELPVMFEDHADDFRLTFQFAL